MTTLWLTVALPVEDLTEQLGVQSLDDLDEVEIIGALRDYGDIVGLEEVE